MAEALQEVFDQYPWLAGLHISDEQRKVCDYLSLFVGEKKYLAASLCVQPGRIDNQRYQEEIDDIVEHINRLYQRDAQYLEGEDNAHTRQIKILFLSQIKMLIDSSELQYESLTKDIAEYALKILGTLPISKIREDLEDRLFEYVDKENYSQYMELMRFSRPDYKEKEERVKNLIQYQLREEGLSVVISSRIKTVFSTHKKILKRNILHSQVLDTIGLRIFTKDENDCYRVLSSILKKWPVSRSKIKDYISIPKENGYQSIHLTVYFENFPIEIQIRSFDMHHFAEYGAAAHRQYKRSADKQYFE